ncbi:unnamed protein product [Polarella glacialis]|uniref:Uncharacterized protein n=1 Tax=Polarella glacialis TaxID=89957 RepID=A0A813HGA1_POLGL|nr:unnamed protein product [Polarella glacialis]
MAMRYVMAQQLGQRPVGAAVPPRANSAVRQQLCALRCRQQQDDECDVHWQLAACLWQWQQGRFAFGDVQRGTPEEFDSDLSRWPPSPDSARNSAELVEKRFEDLEARLERAEGLIQGLLRLGQGGGFAAPHGKQTVIRGTSPKHSAQPQVATEAGPRADAQRPASAGKLQAPPGHPRPASAPPRRKGILAPATSATRNLQARTLAEDAPAAGAAVRISSSTGTPESGYLEPIISKEEAPLERSKSQSFEGALGGAEDAQREAPASQSPIGGSPSTASSPQNLCPQQDCTGVDLEIGCKVNYYDDETWIGSVVNFDRQGVPRVSWVSGDMAGKTRSAGAKFLRVVSVDADGASDSLPGAASKEEAPAALAIEEVARPVAAASEALVASEPTASPAAPPDAASPTPQPPDDSQPAVAQPPPKQRAQSQLNSPPQPPAPKQRAQSQLNSPPQPPAPKQRAQSQLNSPPQPPAPKQRAESQLNSPPQPPAPRQRAESQLNSPPQPPAPKQRAESQLNSPPQPPAPKQRAESQLNSPPQPPAPVPKRYPRQDCEGKLLDEGSRVQYHDDASWTGSVVGFDKQGVPRVSWVSGDMAGKTRPAGAKFLRVVSVDADGASDSLPGAASKEEAPAALAIEEVARPVAAASEALVASEPTASPAAPPDAASPTPQPPDESQPAVAQPPPKQRAQSQLISPPQPPAPVPKQYPRQDCEGKLLDEASQVQYHDDASWTGSVVGFDKQGVPRVSWVSGDMAGKTRSAGAKFLRVVSVDADRVSDSLPGAASKEEAPGVHTGDAGEAAFEPRPAEAAELEEAEAPLSDIPFQGAEEGKWEGLGGLFD